jgi:hypothetical protein
LQGLDAAGVAAAITARFGPLAQAGELAKRPLQSVA